MEMLASIRLNLYVNTLMKLRVGVLRRWQLHNTGDDQWLSAPMPDGSNQIAVHLSDELHRYLFRAYCFTLAMIGAAAEQFVSHRDHHA